MFNITFHLIQLIEFIFVAGCFLSITQFNNFHKAFSLETKENWP